MLLEEAGDRAPQLTGAEAVDDADRSLIGQHRFVEEALGAGERLVDRAPDQVQLGERSGPRLQLDVHADTRPAHRSADEAQVGPQRPQPLAVHVHVRVLAVQVQHHALETKGAHRYPRAGRDVAGGRHGLGCGRQGTRAFPDLGQGGVERGPSVGPGRARVAGGDRGGRAMPALATQYGGPGLETFDDPVDFFPGLAELVVEFGLEAPARGQFALLHGGLARAELALVLGEGAALLRHGTALGFERLQLPVHAIEVGLELRFAVGEVAARSGDDGGRHTQPRCDLDGEAAAWRSVDEAIGGRECGRVEAERRALHPLGRGRIRLEHVEVRGGHQVRAAAAEVIDDGGAERTALGGVGAGAHLVEQHERRQRQAAIHRHHVGDVRGKRAEAGRDRLLVADVREQALENGQPGAFVGGQVQSGLGHRRKQPRRFQRDGLAARVGSGNDQHPGRRRHQHVHGHRFGVRPRRRRLVLHVLARAGR